MSSDNTGQHWAEKISAEIAGVVGIRRAAVDLALFGERQGSVSKSFVHSDLELVHGNQILSRLLPGYDPRKRFHQADHTLDNILTVMEVIFAKDTSRMEAMSRIAEYLVLDAVIGNTDRHHENWGILRRRRDGSWYGFVAPSFDHASSLGRELLDDRRDRLLDEDRVGNYVARGPRGGLLVHGGSAWSQPTRVGVPRSPLLSCTLPSSTDEDRQAGRDADQ